MRNLIVGIALLSSFVAVSGQPGEVGAEAKLAFISEVDLTGGLYADPADRRLFAGVTFYGQPNTKHRIVAIYAPDCDPVTSRFLGAGYKYVTTDADGKGHCSFSDTSAVPCEWGWGVIIRVYTIDATGLQTLRDEWGGWCPFADHRNDW